MPPGTRIGRADACPSAPKWRAEHSTRGQSVLISRPQAVPATSGAVCPQAALTEVHAATRSEINRFQLERDQVWRHGRSILEAEFESLGQRRLPAQKRMLFWGLGQCADSGSIDIDINDHRTSNPGRGPRARHAQSKLGGAGKHVARALPQITPCCCAERSARMWWLRGPATTDIKDAQLRGRFDIDALRGNPVRHFHQGPPANNPRKRLTLPSPAFEPGRAWSGLFSESFPESARS